MKCGRERATQREVRSAVRDLRECRQPFSTEIRQRKVSTRSCCTCRLTPQSRRTRIAITGWLRFSRELELRIWDEVRREVAEEHAPGQRLFRTCGSESLRSVRRRAIHRSGLRLRSHEYGL